MNHQGARLAQNGVEKKLDSILSIVAIQQSSVAFNIFDLFSNFNLLIFLSIIKMTFMMMKLSLNYISCLLYNWQRPWTT